eukprot:96807-Chlamydomonas_euryale.AAC.2
MDRNDAPHEAFVCDRREAGVLNHAGECLLVRELAYALDQVLVARAVTCHQLADCRDDGERVRVVHLAQPRLRDVRELEAQETAAGP